MMGKYIIELLQNNIRERISKILEKGENEIWVSDLVLCPLRSYFRKLVPELESPTASTILGDIVHWGLEKWFKEVKNADVEVEVERDFELPMGKFKIKGRIDVLLDDEVIELKYMRRMKGSEVLPHHLLQTRIYMWMVETDRGRVIYVTPDAIVEYTVDEPVTDRDVERLIVRYINMDTSEIGEWECQYCSFSQWCSPAIRGEGRK